MNTEPHFIQGALPGLRPDPYQLPMFPLDAWGAEQLVAVIDHPHPGLRRVMLGPLSMGGATHLWDQPLQCLAVSADGHFVALLSLAGVKGQSDSVIWAHLWNELEKARNAEQMPEHTTPITAADSYKMWSKPNTWFPVPNGGRSMAPAVRSLATLLVKQACGDRPPFDAERSQLEQQAQAMAATQAGQAVQQVLVALDVGVFEATLLRPRMSIAMACRLVEQAQMHSPQALAYARQALKTESYGFLELITRGTPEKAAQALRATLFRGESLPNALTQWGISKAAHRRTLVQAPPLQPKNCQELELELSELALSGHDCLFAMQLALPRPLPVAPDGRAFALVIRQLRAFKFSDNTLYSHLLERCRHAGWDHGELTLERLIHQARAISLVAQQEVSLEQALSARLTNTKDTIFLPEQVKMVSKLSGQSIGQLLQTLFNSHPGLPAGWSPPSPYRIKVLNRLDVTSEHGAACDNCLSSPELVIRYLQRSVALYGVYCGEQAMGTIALCLEDTNAGEKVKVWEVSARGNAPADYYLGRVAQSLADSWVGESVLKRWAPHLGKCALLHTPM